MAPRSNIKRSRAPAFLVAVAASSSAAVVGSLLRSFVAPSTVQLRPQLRHGAVARAAEDEEEKVPEVPAPIVWPKVEQKEGMTYGHCLMSDGTWQITEENFVENLNPDGEAVVEKAWQAFKKQYTGASERGVYMDTPVGEQDIKYRFRRLSDTFGISTEKTFEIMADEALPLVVDAEYVKKTFDAMVRGADKEQALEIVTKNPGVLTAGPGIEESMGMAGAAANFISATRPFNQFLQGVLGKR